MCIHLEHVEIYAWVSQVSTKVEGEALSLNPMLQGIARPPEGPVRACGS